MIIGNITNPAINRIGKSLYWNNFFVFKKYNKDMFNKISIFKSFLIIFFKYGLRRYFRYKYDNFFWLNFNKIRTFFKVNTLNYIPTIKVKFKLNKKGFHTYQKHVTIKFLHSMSTIVLNYKNYIIGFLFFFKPKKINYADEDVSFFLLNIQKDKKHINLNFINKVYNF